MSMCFNGALFVQFYDEHLVERKVAKQCRSARNGPASIEVTAFFLGGYRVLDMDRQKIKRLRKSQGRVSLAVVDEFLTRYDIRLSEFEDWAEDRKMQLQATGGKR